MITKLIRRSAVGLCCFFLAGLLAGCASTKQATAPIDWETANRWSVHAVTEDADGDLRVARIWIVQHDATAVIRTQQSRWWKNLARGSFLRIRVGGQEYPVEFEPITDLATRRLADEAFALKYGWQEAAVIQDDRAASSDNYLRLTAQ